MQKNLQQLHRKPNKLWFPLFALLSFIAGNANAQHDIEGKQALYIIQKHAASIGISTKHLNEISISKAYHDAILDADLVYLQQTYSGIPVFKSIMTIAIKQDKVTNVSGKFAATTSENALKVAVPKLQPYEAIIAAAKHLRLTNPQQKTAIKVEKNGQLSEFDGLGISSEHITTELFWVTTNNNQMELCWQVKIVPFHSSDYWLINVNADNGKIIEKINLTVSCDWDNKQNDNNHKDNTHNIKYADYYNFDLQKLAPPTGINSAGYRVIPFPIESPLFGSFALVNNPWLLAGVGNNATTLGWHFDGTTEYNITRGNNVWAKDDRAADNETTIGVSATSSTAAPNYTFDFPFNPATQPTTTTNLSAAITNLFYWNNITHDITYQYGFDEVSGNFQNDNQGRGGAGGDYVLADAQDGSGTNNANFSTPNDGSRPRMQMFLFSPSPGKTLQINSPAGAAGFIEAYEVIVSSNNKIVNVGPVTADLILYDNGTNLGCASAATNAFAGKIVLVQRGGSCNSQAKIKNAQNAGAAGVILYQSDGSAAGSLQTTTDNTVVIPAFLITRANALNLISAMSSGTVNATLSGINIDGDLDNGVIVHEYAHGISNRLTGGPANSSCLSNAEQMGEGWSDYYALMLTTNWSAATVNDGPLIRPIGNYAFGQSTSGGGIRTYPYSTDMTINQWDYSKLATLPNPNPSPHARGEIWAATLWDMTWNIIAIDGINTNLYDANAPGGNSVALKLVTQGMKLQPCSPGFIDGRNAILKADTMLYNGRYSCAIWRAFARRGMGAGASQGSSNSTVDQTATFTLPNFNYDTTVSICNSFTWYDTTIKASGTYTRTFNLPGGCSRTVTLHLTILSVSSTFTKTDARCFGSATGSITITPTSGVAPYTYRIGTVGSYGTNNTFNNLKAGKYRVSILDANGCAGISAQITIDQQPAVTGTIFKTDAGCFGTATGSIIITPSTGTGPYTYRLGTSGAFISGNTFNNLNAGNYLIFIKDANGCIGSVSTTLGQSPAVRGVVTSNPVTGCFGQSNGSLSITASTGVSPFMYKLGTTGTYSNTNTFNGLKAGTYRIFILDASNCEVSLTGTITQPSAVAISVSKTDLTCANSNDGKITATGSGGTAPYTYRFGTTGAFASNNQFNNLAPGTYRVFIKDANNCGIPSAGAIILQSSIACPSVTKSSTGTIINSFVHLSPNPTKAGFILTTRYSYNEPVEIRIIDATGKNLFYMKGNSGQTFKFGENFTPGTYLIEITRNKTKEVLKGIKL